MKRFVEPSRSFSIIPPLGPEGKRPMPHTRRLVVPRGATCLESQKRVQCIVCGQALPGEGAVTAPLRRDNGRKHYK